MKNTIIFLLLIAAIGAKAQTAIKIKSKSPLADSIWINRGAIEVSPLATGNGADTIRSIDYCFSPARDTLGNFIIYVASYNKVAGLVLTDRLFVSQALYSKWKVLINALDAYIIAQRKRINKL